MIAVIAPLTVGSPRAHAQIQLDRFFPPAVGIGAANIITAEGKFPNWPCDIHCDRDDIQILCDTKNGQLQVAIVDGAAPGIAWIRMHDQDSASNLVPLLIEPIKVTSETDGSTGTAAESPRVELPAIIAGRLATRSEVDGVRVSLKSGQTFIVSVVANRILQSPMDAVLQIADTDGNVLAQVDDSRGLDPQLVYQVSEDTDVVVRLFAFPATPNSTVGFSGAKTYVYLLRMTTGSFLDHVSPIFVGAEQATATAVGWNLPESLTLKRGEVRGFSPSVWHLGSQLGWHLQDSVSADAINVAESNTDQTVAQANSLPVVFSGQISESKQVDRFRFQVTAGKKYIAHSFSRSHGFLLDAVLRIVDVKSGKEVARKDDVSRTDFDAAVEFKAKEDADYELQISDAVEGFGKRHAYAVWLREAAPNVELSVAEDHYLLSAGGTVEIPVTVARQNGFESKFVISARGLPRGVSVADAVSETKGESAKTVKLKLSAADEAKFQGNIRFVGVVLDEKDQPTGQEYTVTHALPASIALPEIWLTVK